ncbi:hypothetical protein AAF712_015228 [Marasmius tenuissimus]|uniref:Uncharacterized protein n=1 Tax=Marasmius tenuissimus TaxID=585030 RepID=A0ABR2Z8X8_9AGAR
MQSGMSARPQHIKLSYREQLRHFLTYVEEEEACNMSRPWSLSSELEDTLRQTFEDVKFEWEDLDGTRWTSKDSSPEDRSISPSREASCSEISPRSVVTERAPAPTTLEPSPVIFDSTEARVLGNRTNGQCLQSRTLSLTPTSLPELSRTFQLRDLPYIDGESSKVFSRPSILTTNTIGANSHNGENSLRTPSCQLGRVISFQGSAPEPDDSPDVTWAFSNSLSPETPKRAKSSWDENSPFRTPTSRPKLTRTPSYRQLDFEDDESDRIFMRFFD